MSYSIHTVETASIQWESVVEADPYFKGVHIIASLDEFVKLIQADRTLTGLDVGMYILTKISCSHLKLQKIVYMCYADYLCQTGKKLFVDEFYAFEMGPVVKTVYDAFKGQGDKPISQREDLKMPEQNRILFAEGGVEKVFSIDRTIARIGELSATALVDLTHRKGSPWEKSFKGGFHDSIPDFTIQQFHYVEMI